jgi:hypothetical protein
MIDLGAAFAPQMLSNPIIKGLATHSQILGSAELSRLIYNW